MYGYLVRRILSAIPVLLLVAFFVFSLLVLVPGDPAVLLAGEDATREDVLRIRESLGLDEPFLFRFMEWLGAVVRGDLGTSLFTELPVLDVILQRLEPTMMLMLMTFLLSVVVAIPLGVLAAWMHNRFADRAIMVFAVFSFSVPAFAVGYGLAWIFGLELRWLPVQGYTPLSEGLWPAVRSLILPALALGSVYIALITRITRATMLETLKQDYVRTARAKGAGTGGLLFRHALKNAAVPIVTVIGSGVALLVGGAVVTETVFAIPGIGRLTVDSILRRDFPVIQGVTLLFSTMYVLINLAVDILYTVFDPRIRY